MLGIVKKRVGRSVIYFFGDYILFKKDFYAYFMLILELEGQ